VPPEVAHLHVVERCREKVTLENSLVVNALPDWYGQHSWRAHRPSQPAPLRIHRFSVAEACDCGCGM